MFQKTLNWATIRIEQNHRKKKWKYIVQDKTIQEQKFIINYQLS